MRKQKNVLEFLIVKFRIKIVIPTTTTTTTLRCTLVGIGRVLDLSLSTHLCTYEEVYKEWGYDQS